MIVGKILKNGSRDPAMPSTGVVCHPKAGTWNTPPAYKIWLQPFWRYDWGHQN